MEASFSSFFYDFLTIIKSDVWNIESQVLKIVSAYCYFLNEYIQTEQSWSFKTILLLHGLDMNKNALFMTTYSVQKVEPLPSYFLALITHFHCI